MPKRCPLCRSRDIEPSDRRLYDMHGQPITYPCACASCGLLVDPQRCPGLEEAIRRWFNAGHVDAAIGAGFGMDAYTLRMAATAAERLFVVRSPQQADALAAPHSERAGCGALVPANGPGGSDISLGYLCREDEVDAVLAGARAHLSWAREIVLLCDGRADKASTLAGHGVRMAWRPLDGDFASQRNALQDLSGCDWMLQLDADETLPPQAGPFLRSLAAHAGAQGVTSIGLRRNNCVDGVLSDVFPDTQYRLNRRALRFSGRVHERPDRPWQHSMITLHASLTHHLSGAHVAQRSRRYEALAPGQGRLDEEAALSVPYRD